MKTVTYIYQVLSMKMADFMAEWRELSPEDQEWYRQAAREECAVLGIELE